MNKYRYNFSRIAPFIARLVCFRRNISCDDAPLTEHAWSLVVVIGINPCLGGGVATLPEFRGRGCRRGAAGGGLTPSIKIPRDAPAWTPRDTPRIKNSVVTPNVWSIVVVGSYFPSLQDFVPAVVYASELFEILKPIGLPTTLAAWLYQERLDFQPCRISILFFPIEHRFVDLRHRRHRRN